MKPKRVNHDEWNFSGEQFITKAFGSNLFFILL